MAAVAPPPPQNLPSIGANPLSNDGHGLGGNSFTNSAGGGSVNMLQSQLQNSDYSTYAGFVARVKRLPRTSASRLEHDAIMQALKVARLGADPGLFMAVLRDLDRARDKCVSFVTLQNFLGQSWPKLPAPNVQTQALLASGPSPDDPYQGHGAAQYSLPTDNANTFTPIVVRALVPSCPLLHPLSVVRVPRPCLSSSN